jgi:pilus assembly protein CpaB
MKQKTMILIALAVVCGLGASFMTSKLLADRQTAEETIKVLVAKKNLDTGIMLKKPEEMFEDKDVLKETAPKNALTKLEEVKGRQLKIPRRQGDTITQDDLYDDKGAGMMNILPPGHRAVGIRVSSEQIANGFAAVPHSRVDIACSVKTQNERESGTRLILQNVLVLASGQSTIREADNKAMLCDVVTVALTPEDCLKLETAKSKGGLSMLLRPFGETSIVKTGNVSWSNVVTNTTPEGDEDKGAKPGNSISPEFVIPPTTPTTIKLEQQASDGKHLMRLTNGDVTRRIGWSRDGEGNWESQQEPTEPNNDGTSSAPSVRSAQQPGTAATPEKASAPAQKR